MIIMSSVTAVFADENAPLNRGEVAQMLLNAADDYNPGIQKSDIIKGYEDGELHEERLVTRAEALVMLKRAFGEIPTPTGHNERVALTAENFGDIPVWAEAELSPIFNSGIVAGTGVDLETGESLFSPDSNVTGKQMELFTERMFALYGTNPKDDFYASVNKEALDTIEIDPEYMEGSPVISMVKTADDRVAEIVNEIANSNPEKGTIEYQIAALYNSALNFYTSQTPAQSQILEDIEPLKEYLALIDSAKNIGELTAVNNKINDEIAFAPLISINEELMIDGKDNSKHMPVLTTPSIDSTMYYRSYDALKAYLKDLFASCGESEEQAEQIIKMYDSIILKSDVYMQKNSERIEALRETSLTDYINATIDYDQYKGYDYAEIKAMFAEDAGFESVIEASGINITGKIYVSDINMLKSFADYYKDENLAQLKAYAKFSLLSGYGSYLSKELYMLSVDFAENASGVEVPDSPENAALAVVDEYYGDYISVIYKDKYFSDESTETITKMITDIKAVYETMLQNNTWLSDDTKVKAIEKLKAITIKVGGPDEYDDTLLEAEILSPEDGGTYYKNIITIEKTIKKSLPKYFDEAVDKNMWLASSYTVNAYYNPLFNEIIVPAAFVQAPMYDENASYEQNLGGLGFVIAHEITHAFDSTGAFYDKDGNLSLWWTEDDFATFENKKEEMIEFYDGEEAVPGIGTDGEATLGENISDNGALSCITLAASKHFENPDYKAIYESFAKCWAHSTIRQLYEFYVIIDYHSPAKLRVNRCLSNCDKFYEVYGITEKDGMYVAPEERVKIW